jgi:hypothetical protein
MAEKQTWRVDVHEDPDNPDDYIIQLPDELLNNLGWVEGDLLQWIDNNDGSFTLTKLTP